MAFAKTFDEILAETLTFIQNNFAGADVSQGSIFYHLAVAISAVAFGLYENQGFVERQISPGLMTDARILRFGSDYGLSQAAGETFSDYRIRVLSHIRQRPAGGTKLDYIREALLISGVKSARVLGPEDGEVPGNVKVIILSNPTTGTTGGTGAFKLVATDNGFVVGMVGAVVTNATDDTTAIITAFDSSTVLTLDTNIFVLGENYSIDSPIPPINLVSAVEAALIDFKPITVELTVVGGTVSSTEDITMAITGDNADIISIETDIAAYVNGLDLGETLFISQLEAIAVNNGATLVTVSAPAADVSASPTSIILLGTITVT